MNNHLSTNFPEILPYSLDHTSKTNWMLPQLKHLTSHHYTHSPHYRNIIDRVYGGINQLRFDSIEQVPFIPVSLFKLHELRSIDESAVVKVLTSSGTTGQAVSRIYLDNTTAQLQARSLVKISQNFLGIERLPMIILDSIDIIKDRRSYSARGAGILGMAQFGRRPFYALNEKMDLDIDGLAAYIDAAQGQRIFFFGFTFMIWQYVIRVLEQHGIKFFLPDSIMIHTGGWKKLQEQSISPAQLREHINQTLGITQVINFYGMVEQVGSVFFENPLHYLHAPIYSDVIIRDPVTLQPVPHGSVGVIQVVSALPYSYPGHSILTEDFGVVRGVDAPELGMKGAYFEILGRIPKAELRGCSDTFQIPA